MKAFVKKLANKAKKPKHTLASTIGSTPVRSADSMPSAPAGCATVSAQVIQAADVTVSVQLGLPTSSVLT